MLLRSVRDLLRRSGAAPDMPDAADADGCAAAPAATLAVKPASPAERLALTGALWGEGFALPGGQEEVLRLAKPLGLSGASSVLLLGAGPGGAVRSLAAGFGAWVSGFEADPDRLAAGIRLCAAAGLGRRAQMTAWTPADPRLPVGHYHHALALEPLRQGATEHVLAALARSIKPEGQLVLTEVTAAGPAPPPRFAAWLRAENREKPPSAAAIGRALETLGFEVRVSEDITDRHLRQTLQGWRGYVKQLGAARPDPGKAAEIVREAEIWLFRARLMRSGAIRLMRWHALNRRAR